MAYQSKHRGGTIDRQIDRVIDGSVVRDNTDSDVTPSGINPVSGAGISAAIEAAKTALKNRGYIFMGVATPATVAKVSGKCFYLAAKAGDYDSFGMVLPTDALTAFYWEGERWIAERIVDLVTPTEVSQAISLAIEPVSKQVEKNRQDIGAILGSFGEQDFMYGVEWDVTVSATVMTRIGNPELHRTLPIHNMMRGCLLDDDGNVVEYLPRTSWVGQTLDGSKGQVMVELPEHFRKFEEEGNIRRCKLSLYELPGYHRVPKMYISAYEATVQRSTNKLCSVKNTGADYRGGNNNSAWDGTYRTLLGRPATSINRTNFRKYARARNAAATAEWNCLDYNAYKAVFWLYYVEYANRNCQLAFNAEKDASGYAQGGLGSGVTTVSRTVWSEYNDMSPFIPCGVTDSLGGSTGELAYDLLDENGLTLSAVTVCRYRGIENPFGHSWKWVDGVNIIVGPNSVGAASNIYITEDPAVYNDADNVGYSMRGQESRTEGYVKNIIFGEQGEFISAVVGGGSSIFWGDYRYVKIGSSEQMRGLLVGGASHMDLQAGLLSVSTGYGPSESQTYVASRLCFIPQNK